MKKRKTLTFKLVITMTCIVAGTILFSWFLNNTFLERIYLNDRQKQLVSAYGLLSEAYEDGSIGYKDFMLDFRRIYTTNNLDVIVTDDGAVILSTARDRNQIIEQYNEIVSGIRSGAINNGLTDNGNYVITKQQDSSLKEEYMILYGKTGEAGEIFMRTPVKSMRESARITSMFLGITGIIALFISLVVILLMSRSITKPIRELSDISRRMAELHFENKYASRKSSSREIEELGRDINELSTTLEKTISELIEIDEMRKEFLSNVSHELKTPIAIISGYAEGLKECVNDDAESRDYYCEVIMDESEKMNKLVQKLLSLNKLEFGHEVIDKQRFELSDLVSGVIESFKVLMEKEGIKVIHQYNETVYAYGDPFLIEEVVSNYISNAVHYAKGEKEIVISYDAFDSKIRMTVFNTGDNIPAEDISKIWDKFYKVDKARTREYGGSGIGLSIVKAIADLHNERCGVINCEAGVKFWIEFDTNC